MGDVDDVERYASRSLELQPESLGPRWPLTIALTAAGRVDEAIAAAEKLVSRSRSPMFLGVLGMAYAFAGRTGDADLLLQELDERQSRGEYVVPLARLSIHLGLRDEKRVRDSLLACADGGASPSSLVVLIRKLIENYHDSPEISRMLDHLHDGARPTSSLQP